MSPCPQSMTVSADGLALEGTAEEPAYQTGLISTEVARSRQQYVAICAALASITVMLAAAPLARVPLFELPAFIPAYEASLVVIDLITAVLLLGQFLQTRSGALLALTAGYLFDGLMVVPHALTFPGVLSPSGGLGAGMHTTAWLYMFWHGGFPIFVAGYALMTWNGEPEASEQLGKQAAIAVAASVAGGVLLLTLLATAGHEWLPAIMAGNTDGLGQKAVAGVVWLLTATALVLLLLKRPYTVLDLWLIVVMAAWLADIALSAVFDAARYDLGFYAGRIYGLLAASFVLAALLAETGALHRRLAAAGIQLQGQTRALDARVREQTAELAQTSRQLSAVLEASPVAIFMLDPAGTVALWTASAERIFGYTREETLGKLPPYLADEHTARFRADLARTVAGPTSSGSYETRRRRRDGTIIDVSVRWARVSDDSGGALGIMCAVADITDRKRLESQLQQAQKMEALGNLTGGLAHDFNNHLGVILLNLDVLRERVTDDPEAEELAGEAMEAASRGAELIRRLLAFARRQPLQPQRTDVNKLVGETTRLIERLLGEHIKIALDLKDGLWPTVIDPAQLESTLANLANNARDAMPNGGKLRIATDNRQLDGDYAAAHSELAPGDFVMIEVTDTGAGMPPEVLARVYDPFYTTKPPGKGTGLGLSMVYGFIKQSGGHINIYSEVGVGTTVRLYLPRADAGNEAADIGIIPEVALGGGETILAVEDNPSLRRVVVRQLSEIGYRVLEAETAQQALGLLESERVDLVFTDVVMPGGVSGYELASTVAKRWPSIKLVLTSGFPEIRMIGEDELQNLTLLSKPYRREDIARVVRAALEDKPAN